MTKTTYQNPQYFLKTITLKFKHLGQMYRFENKKNSDSLSNYIESLDILK